MTDEIHEIYNNNPEFKEYVNRYAKSREIEKYEALTHITVREAAMYYKDKNANKIAG